MSIERPVYGDGTIYDPVLNGYRQATPEEVAEDRFEHEHAMAGERFWSHIAQGHVRTGRPAVRRDRPWGRRS